MSAVGVRLVRIAAHFQWCGARLQTGLVSENESPAICSAKACRAFATWAVVWNNPRLHTPDREKVWVALRGAQATARRLPRRSFVPQACRTIGAGLVKGSSAPSPSANGDAN